jgi:ferrous-iron efflux pump FieF
MDNKNPAAVKEHTALMSLISDIAIVTPSVVVAVLANSMTLYTDLIGDFNVILTNLVLWVILHRVRKGMGVHYDFGTGKLENLVTLLGAVILILSLGYIVTISIGRLMVPVRLEKGPVLMANVLMVVSVIVYGWLWRRNYRIYKTLPSPVTEIQWRIPMINTLVSAAILLVMFLTLVFEPYPWSAYLDPVVSLIMSFYIIYTFFGLIKTSVFDLLDKTLEENHQLIIVRELTCFYNDYSQLHGVRSRRSGEQIFIDILLEFDPDRRMGDIQQTAAAIKAALESKIQNSLVSIILANGPRSDAA